MPVIPGPRAPLPTPPIPGSEQNQVYAGLVWATTLETETFAEVFSTAGNAAFDSSTAFSGSQSVKVTETGTASAATRTVPTSAIWVGRFWFRTDSIAPTAIQNIFTMTGTGVGTFVPTLRFSLTGHFQAGYATSTFASAPAALLNTWQAIDFRIDMRQTPHTIDWMVDGVAQTQAVSSAAAPAEETVNLFNIAAAGNNTLDLWYDDFQLSTDAGAYPLADIAGTVHTFSSAVTDAGVSQTDDLTTIPVTRTRPVYDRGIARAVGTTFEGMTNGATPAVTDVSAGQDPPDSVGSSGWTYDNTHVAHGTMALKAPSTSGASGWSYLHGFNASGDAARVYVYITALPTSTFGVVMALSGAVNGPHLAVNSSGKLVIRDAANTVQATSVTTIPTGQFIRVEFTWSTTAQAKARIYLSADSTAAADEEITAAANTTTAPTANGVSLGANYGSDVWYDDFLFGTGTYQGWAGSATTNPFLPPDSVAPAHGFPRAVTTTGVSQTDTVSTTRLRGITDTGLSETDTVSTTRLRAVADTGLSETDTVATVRGRAVTDTGESQSDTLATIRARGVTDTGLSETDSVSTTRLRRVTDTGVSETDTVATVRGRAVTDTGLTETDAVATTRLRALTDAGESQTDTVATTRLRVITDTGIVETDAVTAVRGPSIAVTTTGVTQTDAVSTTRLRVVADTGISQSDSTSTLRTRFISTIGVTQSDSVSATRGFQRAVSDTGVAQTDSTSTLRVRFVVTTGVAHSDVVAVGTTRIRGVSDTGESQSDTVFAHAGIVIHPDRAYLGYVNTTAISGVVSGTGLTGIPAT